MLARTALSFALLLGVTSQGCMKSNFSTLPDQLQVKTGDGAIPSPTPSSPAGTGFQVQASLQGAGGTGAPVVGSQFSISRVTVGSGLGNSVSPNEGKQFQVATGIFSSPEN